MFLLKAKDFGWGYTDITKEGETSEDTMMDFGILRLKAGTIYESDLKKERALLLMKGEVSFFVDETEKKATRNSLFDERPSCLHVDQKAHVKITALTDSEIAIISTTNDKTFSSEFYTPSDVENEYRGKGTMQETSTRIVRTIFDKSNAKDANLVLGEVVNYPGKWSSYPPHHHPQPEIYHYRFLPENGFGFATLGDDVYKVKNGDTVKILNDKVHPQVSAPGYAMYYIWVIRHLDGNPYIKPVFETEHTWVMEKDASIWPNRGE